MSTTTQQRDDLHRQTLRTVSLGTFWRFLRYPFVLLSVALIPRAMGDVDYGRYAFFVSLYLILDMSTDFGFMQMFGRFIPECHPDQGDKRSRDLLQGTLIYGTLLPLIVSAGLIVVHAIYPFAGFSLEWVILLCLLLILTRIEGTLFVFLYGMNRIALFSAKEMLRSAFTFGFVWGFYLLFGLHGAIWGLVFNEVFLVILAFYWTRAFIFRCWGWVPFKRYWPYLLFGITFFVPVFIFGLLQRAGNILIQSLIHSPEQVAYFDIANQFLLLTGTFLGLILSTLLPALTALYLQNDFDSICRWQRRIMSYCAMAVVLTFYALVWVGQVVIHAWLGPTFAPAFANAVVIGLAIIPVLISYVGMNYTVLEKAPRIYIRAVSVGVIAMAVSGILLIPPWGSHGAAWATVIGYTAVAAIFLVHYSHYFSKILKEFMIILLLGILPLPAAFYAPLHDRFPIPACAVSCIIFAVLLLISGRLKWADVQKLVHVFSRKKDRQTPA